MVVVVLFDEAVDGGVLNGSEPNGSEPANGSPEIERRGSGEREKEQICYNVQVFVAH